MDYTELLTTNAEDMTTKSEDLSSTYQSKKKADIQYVEKEYLENLHTSAWDLALYFDNRKEYSGYFHINLKDGSVYQGNVHSDKSRALYYRQAIGNKLIKIGTKYLDTPAYKKHFKTELSRKKKRLKGMGRR